MPSKKERQQNFSEFTDFLHYFVYADTIGDFIKKTVKLTVKPSLDGGGYFSFALKYRGAEDPWFMVSDQGKIVGQINLTDDVVNTNPYIQEWKKSRWFGFKDVAGFIKKLEEEWVRELNQSKLRTQALEKIIPAVNKLGSLELKEFIRYVAELAGSKRTAAKN